MKYQRVIARLDVKGPNVVKGVHLEGLRVLGPPSVFAQHYYMEGIDELFYMDVVASLYERNSLLNLISETADSVFIPLTVGGGIRTLSDVHCALRSGADKVCINTAAIKNPNFISETANRFGSSTVVVAIEAIRQDGGRYLAFVDNGRDYTGVDVLEWAYKVQNLGAGEIVLTSVDREGTGRGFDLELIDQITSIVNIPVIVHGGAGNIQHVADVLKDGNVDAVALASLLHYEAINRVKDNRENLEGNRHFLESKRPIQRIQPISVNTLKMVLHDHGISVRL